MRNWKAQRTLLIVGEGAVEEAFLTYAKSLYVPRGCGLSVKIKNAGGKGAGQVVDWTVRQMANTQYDSVAVLLDTLRRHHHADGHHRTLNRKHNLLYK